MKLPAPTSDTSSARSATPVRVKRNAPSIPENPPASRSRAAGKAHRKGKVDATGGFYDDDPSTAGAPPLALPTIAELSNSYSDPVPAKPSYSLRGSGYELGFHITLEADVERYATETSSAEQPHACALACSHREVVIEREPAVWHDIANESITYGEGYGAPGSDPEYLDRPEQVRT